MSILGYSLACALPAFLISLASTAAMRRLAPRWDLVDHPAARKVHVVPTPLGGGIGIVCGFVVPLVVAHALIGGGLVPGHSPAWFPAGWSIHLPGVLQRAPQLWAIIGAGLVLSAVGLVDDRKGLPWLPRLAVQFLLAVGLCALGVRATVFVEQPWVGWIVTIGWIVVLVNAFNFLDNMDALCGGIGLIASSMFAAVMLTSQAEPRWLVGGCLVVLAGSLAGFLVHNRPPARIFMGDAGSTFVGLMLACLTLAGTFYEPGQGSRHVLLAPLCILAVPLYDFTTVLLIRIKNGHSPFHPDKNHFSHRLVALGMSKPHAVLTVHLATVTTGLGGLLLYRLHSWADALLVVALVLCVLTIIAILEVVGRRAKA
jgi:UDP-GlcNAc:undecaprenyl-phosphate/decaprenyl-phosphate GlcNAc-1-phosphate transferase